MEININSNENFSSSNEIIKLIYFRTNPEFPSVIKIPRAIFFFYLNPG